MSDAPEVTPIEIDCRSVKARLDRDEPFLLMDCREQDEFELVKIEGAQLWPMSTIVDRVAELSAHRQNEIVVYCHHGMRSLRVALWLRQQGFALATSMAGGIDQWSVEIDRTLPRY